MNFQLVSSILRSPWLIPHEIAETYLPAISMLLNGNAVEFDFDSFQVKAYQNGRDVSANADIDNMQGFPEGSILEIPLRNTLMKNDQECGPVGTRSIGKMIEQADRDDNINGIVLNIDSPGGQAHGTPQLANIIRNTKKPVVAYIDGMAASAAYWIASAADKVIAEPKSTIGSIGTMTSFVDLQPAYEKLGAKFHKIVSDQSPDKTKLFEQVKAGNYDEYKKQVLNPLTDDFQAAIKAFRPNVKDEQMTGKTFYSENVTGTMIDQIGTFKDALATVDYLAKQQKEISTNIQSNMNTDSLNKVLGSELQADNDGGIYLSQDQLQVLESHLGKPAADSDGAATQDTQQTAKPDLQPVMDVLKDLQNELAQLKADKMQMQATIDRLQDGPGATTAKSTADNDPGKTDGVKLATSANADFWENVQKVKEAYIN